MRVASAGWVLDFSGPRCKPHWEGDLWTKPGRWVWLSQQLYWELTFQEGPASARALASEWAPGDESEHRGQHGWHRMSKQGEGRSRGWGSSGTEGFCLVSSFLLSVLRALDFFWGRQPFQGLESSHDLIRCRDRAVFCVGNYDISSPCSLYNYFKYFLFTCFGSTSDKFIMFPSIMRYNLENSREEKKLNCIYSYFYMPCSSFLPEIAEFLVCFLFRELRSAIFLKGWPANKFFVFLHLRMT